MAPLNTPFVTAILVFSISILFTCLTNAVPIDNTITETTITDEINLQLLDNLAKFGENNGVLMLSENLDSEGTISAPKNLNNQDDDDDDETRLNTQILLPMLIPGSEGKDDPKTSTARILLQTSSTIRHSSHKVLPKPKISEPNIEKDGKQRITEPGQANRQGGRKKCAAKSHPTNPKMTPADQHFHEILVEEGIKHDAEVSDPNHEVIIVYDDNPLMFKK
ncbi:hypothetical protein G9A89_005821 [Geosiphon pyriformis]|nr:hypothetical protein G9A89_005821 [Geosiphon pyriformis]